MTVILLTMLSGIEIKHVTMIRGSLSRRDPVHNLTQRMCVTLLLLIFVYICS